MDNDRTITLVDIEGVYKKLHDATYGETFLNVDGYQFKTDIGYVFDGIDIYHKFLLQLFDKDFIPTCEEEVD